MIFRNDFNWTIILVNCDSSFLEVMEDNKMTSLYRIYVVMYE